MITAVKTTLTFSPAFHLKLKMAAERTKKPLAKVVEEKLTPVLEQEERAFVRKMYKGLFELAGMVKDNILDASITVDDVLYGEWQEKQGGK